MKKTVLIYSVAILLIIVISITLTIIHNKKDNQDEKTIKVNEVTRSVFYAPQYVAINKGYFKENGINVELTTGQGADSVMTAVLSNQCDIQYMYTMREKKIIVRYLLK